MVTRYSRVSSRVLCLSGLAAALATLGFIAELTSQKKANDQMGNTKLIMGIAFLCSLIIPCCGWYGAKQRNTGTLCCFSAFNYIMGCGDCLFATICICLMAAIFPMKAVISSCEPTGMVTNAHCTEKRQQQLDALCKQFDSIYQNATAEDPAALSSLQWNGTHVSNMLSEQHCLDTLGDITTFVLVAVVCLAILRCCLMGLHCSSGYYGKELREMIQDQKCDSDSSDSENSEDFCH